MSIEEKMRNEDVYKQRFASEGTFPWNDKFKALLVRFECKDAYFLGAHFIAFTIINLRHSNNHTLVKFLAKPWDRKDYGTDMVDAIQALIEFTYPFKNGWSKCQCPYLI